MLIVDVLDDDYSMTEISLDTEAKSLLIEIVLKTGERVERINRSYQNLTMLSADLACEIGSGPSIDLLTRFDVPRNSELWFLNHNNPWRQ